MNWKLKKNIILQIFIRLFQNLQIPTKIVKTQIEISADKQIIAAGEKIGTNEAALLQKLGINPFSYKLKVAHVFDNGQVHNPAVLDIKTYYSFIEFKTIFILVLNWTWLNW